jgi:hypothetical protein
MLNQVGEELFKRQSTAVRGDKGGDLGEVVETAVSDKVMQVTPVVATRASE